MRWEAAGAPGDEWDQHGSVGVGDFVSRTLRLYIQKS